MVNTIVANDNINIIELLMTIKEDVSVIKTDMNNLKEVHRLEKEMFRQEIQDVRNDFKRDIDTLSSHALGKIKNIQESQNELAATVNNLKQENDKKDAKRWRTTIGFVATGFAGMIVARIPNFIAYLIQLGGN